MFDYMREKKNEQYPNKNEYLTEEFEVVSILDGKLILMDKDGNNVRVRYSFPNLYNIGEKIYKENGTFLWKSVEQKED